MGTHNGGNRYIKAVYGVHKTPLWGVKNRLFKPDSLFFEGGTSYFAALAALMDSISSGTTLNRSPVMP